MDRQAVFALIPIVGLFFTGLIAFSFTRLGRALANRIESRIDSRAEARLAALEESNDQLRQALDEAHERLDFAERALTRGVSGPIHTPV
jgi:hypothetical protein